MSSDDQTTCPDPRTLEALSGGRLPDDEAARVTAHLDECDACCRRLDNLGADLLTALLPEDTADLAEPDASETSALLARSMSELSATPGVVAENLPKSLGGHEIRGEVARGGMGVVLEGYDPDLQRTVAIKVLAPGLAADPKFREAFLAEARAAARLQHENVMPVYAVDQDGGMPYLVMPFVEGPNLQELLDAHGALGIDETVTLAHQVCRALEAAHLGGLVHGDVKPGNVMLLGNDGERRAMLADFGLARAAGSPSRRGGRAVAGTPGFMAPEQLAGQAGDHRSDLYALGCVLFSMLSGGRPPSHDGPEGGAGEPPPLRTVAPGVPRWLDDLVSRLLATDPRDRPQSATEVRSLLERHLAQNRLVTRRGALAAGSLLAAAAAVGIVWRPRGKRDEAVELPLGFFVGMGGEAPRYDTLAEAVQAAPAGGTVVVRQTGEIEIEPVAIPADKALTIRAAAGCHPVLRARSWRTSMIASQAPLCLEGLELRHPFADEPGEAAPIIHCRGHPVYLANCRFVRSTAEPRGQRQRPGAKPLVRLDNCLRVEISGCEFYTMSGTDVAIHVMEAGSESSLHARNNLFVGKAGIRLDSPGSCRHAWRLERNTVAAAIPLTIRSRGKEFSRLDLAVEQNLFDFLNSFMELRNLESAEAVDQAVERTALTGSGNWYRPTGRLSSERDSIYVMLSGVAGAGAAVEEIASFEAFLEAFGPTGRELPEAVFDWDRIEQYRGEFALMTPELFVPDGEFGNAAGFERELLGPGDAYRRWRESEEHAAWSARVAQAVR